MSLGPAEILVLLAVVLVVVGPRRVPDAARHLRRAGRVPRRQFDVRGPDAVPGGSA